MRFSSLAKGLDKLTCLLLLMLMRKDFSQPEDNSNDVDHFQAPEIKQHIE